MQKYCIGYIDVYLVVYDNLSYPAHMSIKVAQKIKTRVLRRIPHNSFPFT